MSASRPVIDLVVILGVPLTLIIGGLSQILASSASGTARLGGLAALLLGLVIAFFSGAYLGRPVRDH